MFQLKQPVEVRNDDKLIGVYYIDEAHQTGAEPVHNRLSRRFWSAGWQPLPWRRVQRKISEISIGRDREWTVFRRV